MASRQNGITAHTTTSQPLSQGFPDHACPVKHLEIVSSQASRSPFLFKLFWENLGGLYWNFPFSVYCRCRIHFPVSLSVIALKKIWQDDLQTCMKFNEMNFEPNFVSFMELVTEIEQVLITRAKSQWDSLKQVSHDIHGMVLVKENLQVWRPKDVTYRTAQANSEN